MTFNDIIKDVNGIKEILSTKVCDKLNGDCNKCPFKEDCVVSKLCCIELDIQILKGKVKEII